MAHVKWFLDRSEADILRDPKPELFTQLSFANVIPIACAVCVLLMSTVAGRDFSGWRINLRLSAWCDRVEPGINLFMGLCTGGLLIYCALTRTLLAPNFIICAHCPWWLPYVECFAGCSLLVGLFARLGAGLLLFLLAFTFVKHSAADCLDLVPLYGLGLYFLLAGRERWSLDHLLRLDRLPDANAVQLAHLCVRWSTGVGLMILALDEKLLHPQLALALLKHASSLNFVGAAHMSNEMFVLCAGLVEMLLGLVVVVGSFPRVAMLMMAGLFAATTKIFGVTELYGHLPYYAIIGSIALRGSGTIAPFAVLQSAAAQLRERLRQPLKLPA
jgi:uncharacterized membrane protein YphA (DoxX/SURF4 family)